MSPEWLQRVGRGAAVKWPAVNPKISVFRNQVVEFDLSDSSLSHLINSIPSSSFDFDFYTDSDFKNIFNTSKFTNSFEIKKSGRIGISTDAKVTLYVSDNIPKSLYYTLKPVSSNTNIENNIKIIADSVNILSNNHISVEESGFSGNNIISGITSTTFSFNIAKRPEVSSYLSSEAVLSYVTNSFTAKGPIDSFRALSRGSQYKSLPKIVSISSSEGKQAIISPYSDNIGKIVVSEIEDVGFDYSADKTIRPTVKLPQVLKVDTLLSFNFIGISSFGKNYTKSPDLIVIDSVRGEVIDDVDLRYNLEDKSITVVRDTAKLSDSYPIILPINNSNGIGINSITFNETTKDVTVSLATTYTSLSDYPFEVGDEVLIEGTNVGTASTLKGYNSSAYNYSLFKLTSVNPNLGGTSTVTYNLADKLSSNELPGIFDASTSYGNIVPKKFFPTFNMDLLYNNFFTNEEITSDSVKATIFDWNFSSKILKVYGNGNFKVGDIIKGSSSNTHGIIKSVDNYVGDYTIGASSIVKEGSKNETGFLNNNYQKIHDSDYYQFFSYSIKTKIDYNQWDDVVTSQNHTLGFKKFGDLIVESSTDSFSGISTEQDFGDFVGISDYSETIDFETVNDFDFAKEKTIKINSQVLSSELILKNVEASNYLQSVNNRVLAVDNISDQFNSEERSTVFSVTNTFKRNSNRSKKYIVNAYDRRFSGEKQTSLVTILHDDNFALLNQYAKVATVSDLGSFDISFIGDEANLLFYPNQYQTNDFNINFVSYDLIDSSLGISTLSFGDSVKIESVESTILPTTIGETEIVSISTSYSFAKILLQISSKTDNYYEYNEISLINNGNQFEFLEYGQFNNSAEAESSVGLGTYGISYSGSTLILSFTPNNDLNSEYITNALVFSLSDSVTSTDSIKLNTNLLKSSSVSIASTPSPQEKVVSSYDKRDFDSSYYIVCVSDRNNNRKQMSEVIVVSNTTDSHILEYGRIITDENLCQISSKITGDNVELCATPLANTSLEIRVFETTLGLGITNPGSSSPINLGAASLNVGSSIYNSTSSTVKRQFNLEYNRLPIFQREFEADNPNIVNLLDNTIKIPNHFFVTGEKVNYTYEGELSSPIGIAETSFVGVGATDKLSTELYIIKINDSTIKLASSAENALKEVPNPINILSVGVGSAHKLTSTNQNTKSLITLDNVIQSPVVSTAITASTTAQILISDDIIRLSGVSSIFAGDILKIDNEIVKIKTVGYGQTNSVLVNRAWMGTGISSHSQGTLATKLFGSYNIVNNTINFIDPPFGPTPFTSNKPNEVDWVGITTYSSFGGRIFLRSGFQGTSEEAYSTNYILDDISSGFNGIKTDFILKSNGNDVSGIVTSNGILLINQVFQTPQRLTFPNPIVGNYLLEESAGITTIKFNDGELNSTYDINSSNVPKGGIIVSVGSTKGFGYQPLVSAGGTPIISVGGTIQSISIGNSGSGYRAKSYYNIESFTNSNISIGSTLIYIENKNSIFKILEKLSNQSNFEIGIGTYITNANIVSIGSSFVTIGIGSTSQYQIPQETQVSIKVNNPSIGFVNVGIASSSSGISTVTHIGFATISNGSIVGPIEITNVGFGYTTSNLPTVIFDNPISYSNIPLVYSNASSLGFGTGATIDIVVGQGSSIIDFEIKNFGYGYGQGEILTVDTNNITGIPTSNQFSEFNITIEKTLSDTFSGWSFGDLKLFDSIDDLFNGSRRIFSLKVNNSIVSIKSKLGSPIDIQSCLLVFLNNVLQVPGNSYTFDGGSSISFSEPPKVGDICTILFYEGTSSVDVVPVTPIQKIKIGDSVQINDDTFNFLSQDSRTVTDILSVDSIRTNNYGGPGITENESLLRPMTLYRQREDIFVNGKEVTKDRIQIEPLIQPTTNIIQTVSLASTEIHVESVRTFFDSKKEYITGSEPQNKIIIVSQDNIISAAATAIISPVGIVSSILITEGGSGYDPQAVPDITIQNPIGFGSEFAPRVRTIVSAAGTVSSVNIDFVGSGYTTTKPPIVLIEPPSPVTEVIDNITYKGDFGTIVGYGQTMVGIQKYKIFDLYIPDDSTLRDQSIVGIAITISQIEVGDYFVIKDSVVSISTDSYPSYRNDGSLIGISTQFIDSIYQVSNIQILNSNIIGIGTTYIKRVFVKSDDSSSVGLSTIGLGSSTITFDSTYYTWDYFDTSSLTSYSTIYYGGEYTWGKLTDINRINPKQFNSYGINGITTSASVIRVNPLKYNNYS